MKQEAHGRSRCPKPGALLVFKESLEVMLSVPGEEEVGEAHEYKKRGETGSIPEKGLGLGAHAGPQVVAAPQRDGCAVC